MFGVSFMLMSPRCCRSSINAPDKCVFFDDEATAPLRAEREGATSTLLLHAHRGSSTWNSAVRALLASFELREYIEWRRASEALGVRCALLTVLQMSGRLLDAFWMWKARGRVFAGLLPRARVSRIKTCGRACWSRLARRKLQQSPDAVLSGIRSSSSTNPSSRRRRPVLRRHRHRWPVVYHGASVENM